LDVTYDGKTHLLVAAVAGVDKAQLDAWYRPQSS